MGLATTIPGYVPEGDEVLEGCDPVFLDDPPAIPVQVGCLHCGQDYDRYLIEWRVQTTPAGPHRVGVAFRRRTFAESDDVQQMFAPGGGQDRMYRINSFQVRGPFNPKGVSATPSRDRIFSCYPPAGSTPAQAKCAQCGEPRLPHRVCRSCGFYAGVARIEIPEEA